MLEKKCKIAGADEVSRVIFFGELLPSDGHWTARMDEHLTSLFSPVFTDYWAISHEAIVLMKKGR